MYLSVAHEKSFSWVEVLMKHYIFTPADITQKQGLKKYSVPFTLSTFRYSVTTNILI